MTNFQKLSIVFGPLGIYGMLVFYGADVVAEFAGGGEVIACARDIIVRLAFDSTCLVERLEARYSMTAIAVVTSPAAPPGAIQLGSTRPSRYRASYPPGPAAVCPSDPLSTPVLPSGRRPSVSVTSSHRHHSVRCVACAIKVALRRQCPSRSVSASAQGIDQLF